jgi:Tfp pilus assembly protein PilF
MIPMNSQARSDAGMMRRFLLGIVLTGSTVFPEYSSQVFAAEPLIALSVPPQVGEIPRREQVTDLIARLGSEQFSLRERAQAELENLGPAIYEEILPALRDRDPEIATRAARLIAKLRYKAAEELPEGKHREELRNYFSESDDERRNLVSQPATLSETTRIPLWCLVVRYETNEELAKLAALNILAAITPKDVDKKPHLEQIQRLLARGRRPAAQWLLSYAKFSDDPTAYLERMQAFESQEMELYSTTARLEQRTVATRLLKHALAYASEQQQRPQSIALFKQLLEIDQPDAQSLPQLLDWVVQHQAWELMPEVEARFPKLGESTDPRVIYFLAEAALKQGNTVQLEAYLQRASEIQPQNASLHYQTAMLLYKRGLHDWVERECALILKNASSNQGIMAFNAHYLLAEIQNDQERYREAAESLTAALDLFTKSDTVREHFEDNSRIRYQFSEEQLKTKRAFNRGLDAARNGEHEVAYKAFQEALSFDNHDADVLIAIYRLPKLSAEQREANRKSIRESLAMFQDQIHSDPEDSQGYNQYAWLVANTEGDFDLALEYSLKSVELRPNSGGLQDTLAHCYFAKQDYANAVKTQEQAARLEANSHTIKRALEKFRKAKEEATAQSSLK